MAAERSPLIHIGYQKTASTFLQNKVFSDVGVFSMPWGPQAAEAIEHFVLRHPERFSPEEVRAGFVPEPGRIPVVSHEDLSGYPVYGRYYMETVAERLKTAFPDARILICVREQVSMLMSQYFQYVRQGGTRRVESLLGDNEGRPGFRPVLRRDHFEYDLAHRIFRRRFPEERILMLPFELLAADPEAYFGVLGDFLAIRLDWRIARNVVHARRGGAGMMLERAFNRVLPNPAVLPPSYEDYPLRVRARNRAVRIGDAFLNRFTSIGPRHERAVLETIEGMVGDHYSASNRNLSVITGLDLAALGYRT